jgi:cytochrome P450
LLTVVNAALRGYESRVFGYTELLLKQIEMFGGQPLDASKWFNYYSFDVMGDLAFGKSFDMLKKGESHFAIDLLHNGQMSLGVVGPVPWLLLLGTRLPIVSRPYWTFVNWCTEQVRERQKMKVEEPDVMSWLLEGEPISEDPQVNEMWLSGDARLLIVAGSDTTAATLTHIFYFLGKEPSHIRKIRDEIASLGPDVELNDTSLRGLRHLHAVIEETLRLCPPVPGGVVRQSPPEGIYIGDTFIPGNTGLVTPTWTMNRSKESPHHLPVTKLR